MTTATTAPTLTSAPPGRYRTGPETLHIPVPPDTTTSDAKESNSAGQTYFAVHCMNGPANWRYVITAPSSGSNDCYPEIRQHGDGENILFIVDFREPEVEFPRNQAQAVRFLRTNGRPVLADRLFAILREAEENPEEVTVNFASLRDMARFMVEHDWCADPAIAPDGWGIFHTTWRIADGVLVISFLGSEEVLLTIRASGGREQNKLRVSKRARTQNVLRECGYLVPPRY